MQPTLPDVESMVALAKMRRKKHMNIPADSALRLPFRSDIQVLRGVAVLLVVAFHLDLRLFPAGFLGVDIFFAVSGYLMAGLYDPNGIRTFYRRRANRLLPAYFATVIATGLVGVFFVTPNTYGQIPPQLSFASVFASNIGFWLSDSYFDKLLFRPLLHLWSLGVEIQFYLLLPLLAAAFRKTRLALPLVAAASLALCWVVLLKSPKTAFLWLPFRLWEFLVGYACFAMYRPRLSSTSLSYLGLCALAALLFLATMPVDGLRQSIVYGHPGLAALLAVLLTSVVLVMGLPGAVLDGAFFSGLRRIGDVSYSLYLVHFPVITFMLYQPARNLTPANAGFFDVALCLLIVLLLTAVSYRWVERLPRTVSLKSFVVWSWLAIGLLVSITPMIQSFWIPSEQRNLFLARRDVDTFRCGRMWRMLNPTGQSCLVASPSNAVGSVMLVGNSHADSLKRAFTEEANRAGYSVWFLADNRPMMSGGHVGLAEVLSEIDRLKVSLVVAHYSQEAITVDTLARLAEELQARGIALKWLAPVPVWHAQVPMMLWQHMNGRGALEKQTEWDYQKVNRPYIEAVRAMQASNLEVFESSPFFCQPECRLMDDEGRPLYLDDTHVSLTGARLLAPQFRRMLGLQDDTSAGARSAAR